MSKYELHAEAACCIWEALLEHHFKNVGRSDDPIMTCFEQRGTSEMRHAAIALSVLCSDLWYALPEDERPDCFDWDFVPAFVDMLTWDASGSSVVIVPSLDDALALYRKYWREQYGVIEARPPSLDYDKWKATQVKIGRGAWKDQQTKVGDGPWRSKQIASEPTQADVQADTSQR